MDASKIEIPRGLISLWHGTLELIPRGWLLCNGSYGTPDLRDRFIVGAGSSYAVGATGGAASHTHDFTGDGHTHDMPGGSDMAAGGNYNENTNPGSATGETDSANSRPPYYAVFYIMKA